MAARFATGFPAGFFAATGALDIPFFFDDEFERVNVGFEEAVDSELCLRREDLVTIVRAGSCGFERLRLCSWVMTVDIVKIRRTKGIRRIEQELKEGKETSKWRKNEWCKKGGDKKFTKNWLQNQGEAMVI